MEVTICQFCHKLVYVGYVEHSRFLFDDQNLQHAHTKTKCQFNQNNNDLENSVKVMEEQVTLLKEEVLKIKEKIGLE